MAIVLVFSGFMLLRGHNEPGGGFIAGLLGAGAFSLHLLAFGEQKTSEVLRVDLRVVVGVGLMLSLLSGLWAVVLNQPFLTAQWVKGAVPGVGKLGTVLMFDVGVYLVVFGSVLLILMSLGKREN